MRLTSLAVRDWRNLADTQLSSDARFVVLHGENAQGKTNLLEAVYALATLRSFRESRPARLIRHGQEEATIEARVQGESGARRLLWAQAEGGRRLAVDGAPATALQEWFQLIRVVLFCPEHIAIIRGLPAERRQFLDRARFTARPAYLELVKDYRRVLKQKAALLRGPASDSELALWDHQLAISGAAMAAQRQDMLDQLRDPFQEMHRMIAGNERVDLRIRGVGIPGLDPGSLLEILARARPEERRRGMILAGPHRDDLEILLNGRPARVYASQGQARSLVLALKLAEIEAARRRGHSPLFLLDDLSSELDRRRMQRLVELLAGMDNQVWITTTDPAHLGPLPPNDSARWEVAEGAVQRPAVLGVQAP